MMVSLCCVRLDPSLVDVFHQSLSEQPPHFLVSTVWSLLVALVGAHQVVCSLVQELSRLQDAQT